ncbi:TIGR03621 family F420-dependent LLM class oxidoreductase [Ktedonospora formicarum]|uniref:LLM class F420-dependent oxidoreductase n=1 Tax=Ktedonospora formicarum TaxID=2778364 RepID=A0A8J3MVM4_9CHLR|nr:TIGR03621 family F420-dependent LLM class oxidoreductase [Ktedonospora formicarum]GHO48086.1 LLM class F420-dependent oxidoreductase [Ktedonospora formicarum]
MATPFRFGVVTGGEASRAAWIDFARRAEDLGYSSLLMPDRIMLPLALFPALTIAAEATTTLRVGSYVFCNDLRHPAILAKDAATLDLLSDGRLELGIGAGVGPDDYERLGIPFESAGTRVGRVEEAVQIIKRLFTEERVSFEGKYYTLKDAPGTPSPTQKPHPPIFIGSAGRRLLTFAARHANCIAPNLRWGQPGTQDATLEEKIGWIREAAGERFAHIELCQVAYDIELTDSSAPIGDRTGGPRMPMRKMSTEQAIEHLLEGRERYGFSYIQVSSAQMEHLAPVIARLAGK